MKLLTVFTILSLTIIAFLTMVVLATVDARIDRIETFMEYVEISHAK